MEPVRLRLVFDDYLSSLQNIKSPKRCWILLKSQHQTITDLSSYLLNVFNLQNHCPHGLLLSMEDFALPGFESTSIFKDKDTLRVEKNGGPSYEIVMEGDEVNNNALEVVEIVDTQRVTTTGMNLLANDEFNKESGGYQSEEEEDDDDVSKQEEETVHVENALEEDVAEQEEEEEEEEETVHVENVPEVKTVSKKRKATKKLKSLKRKKTKSATAEKHAAIVEDKGENVCAEQTGSLSTVKVDERSDNAVSKSKRCSQPLENGDRKVDASPTTSGTKKLSRSTRRKKAKRQLRVKLIADTQKQRQRQLHKNTNQQSFESANRQITQALANKGNQDVSEELPERNHEELQEDNQQPDKDSDLEDDVVPVVIRPGHIRFQPLSEVDADQDVQKTQIRLETFQWNGITSKKKGQKWGTEKATSYRKNDYTNANQECSKMRNGRARPVLDVVDFDRLEFYTTLPKEGDIIAYRLIELSPSWTPELTSYRVGKISKYDMRSNRVRLVPVPGYPVITKEKEMSNNDSAGLSETTAYAKDGSLWIEFSSLIEVRLVTPVNSNSVKSVAAGVCEVSIRDQDNGTGFRSNYGDESHVSVQENGVVNSWEEISQALEVKKAELAQEDNWKKAESSGRRSWSYKALRGSALGPTMALLRAQNEI